MKGIQELVNRLALMRIPIVNVTAASISFLAHGGCQVNGPKVAKFLDR